MAAPLAFTDLKCPKCGYALKGLTSSVCPECGVEVTPALLERSRSRAKRNRWLFSLLVVAFILYAPHGWLLFIDHPWNDQRWLWMRLWPILPGLPATLLIRPLWSRHLPDWMEFVLMGAFTALGMLLFTWIASRSRRAMIAVIILLTPPSIYLGIVSHALFQL